MSIPRPGDRIRFVAMPDDPNPVPAGSTGTVTFVNEHGSGDRAWLQIGVDWENGRRLMLSVPPDGVQMLPRDGQGHHE